jgi:hypothetical protein
VLGPGGTAVEVLAARAEAAPAVEKAVQRVLSGRGAAGGCVCPGRAEPL